MDLPKARELTELVSALAPGLIMLSVRQHFSTAPRPELQERVVSYAAISIVYYAVVSPLASYAASRGIPDILIHAVEYIGLPLVLGLLLGVSLHIDWHKRLWRHVGIWPIHHIPTAWDYAFREVISGNHLIITLKDGSKVAGEYLRPSFSSTSPSERDLLIGRVWEIGKDGAWQLPATPKSVLICGQEIRAVEIFHGASDE